MTLMRGTVCLVLILMISGNVFGDSVEHRFRRRYLKKLSEYRNRLRERNLTVKKELPIVDSRNRILKRGEWFCGVYENVTDKTSVNKNLEYVVKSDVGSSIRDSGATWRVIYMNGVSEERMVILDTEYVRLSFGQMSFMKELESMINQFKVPRDIRLKETLSKELQKSNQMYLNDIRGENRIDNEKSAGYVIAALLDKGQAEVYCKRERRTIAKIVLQKSELGSGFISASGGRRYFTPSGQKFLDVEDWSF